MDGQVRVEQTDRVAWLTLDRPTAKNALTGSMLTSLREAVDGLADNDDVDVVAMRGAGSDFCAGSDLGDIASVLEAPSDTRLSTFAEGMRTVIHPITIALLNLKQPLIVSARGHAVGLGALFVLAADLVVLSETGKVTMPQVRLGHTVDHGESWLLPRRVGPSKAMQLCLLGEQIGATDAERFGLANWVTEDAELECRTEAIVADLLAVAPIPLLRTKALLRTSLETGLTAQLRAEVDSASACAATDDFVEAVSAQIERRSATYTRS